jgi:hypothetical protein
VEPLVTSVAPCTGFTQPFRCYGRGDATTERWGWTVGKKSSKKKKDKDKKKKKKK